MLTDLEYADDAGLADTDVGVASTRITNLNTKAEKEAGMSISVPKTKVQHIRRKPSVSETTEEDIKNLPSTQAFRHICEKCDRPFPTRHGLAVHKGRWCKGRRGRKPASRKGSVADRVIKLMKVKDKQQILPHVNLGNETLTTVKHRTDIAWGRFADFRTVMTSTKLSIAMRLCLFHTLIVSTMVYGCSAWIVDDQILKTINGVNSRMVSQITGRFIHDEAKEPSLDIVGSVMHRRWSYLGHILRMDEQRMVKRFLLELLPKERPFIRGTLLDDTPFETVEEAVSAAYDRKLWNELFICNSNMSLGGL